MGPPQHQAEHPGVILTGLACLPAKEAEAGGYTQVMFLPGIQSEGLGYRAIEEVAGTVIVTGILEVIPGGRSEYGAQGDIGQIAFLTEQLHIGGHIYITADAAFAGLGIGPICPLLYGVAGQVSSLSAARAASVVSVIGYTGLLFCPPLFGFLAHLTTYSTVYEVVSGLLLVLMLGNWVLFRLSHRALKK